MEPTESDIIEYFNNVIMADKPFYKVYEMSNPASPEKPLKLVYRTRSDSEASQVAALVETNDELTPILRIKLIDNANLSFSLVQFGETEYDKGTLDERLKKLEEVQAHKKGLMWDYLNEFENYSNTIRELHRNF